MSTPVMTRLPARNGPQCGRIRHWRLMLAPCRKLCNCVQHSDAPQGRDHRGTIRRALVLFLASDGNDGERPTAPARRGAADG